MKYIIAGITVLLVGCANPINQKTAENYYGAALYAQQSGNWQDARKYFSRAIVNAEYGGGDESTLAVLWYEYGRSSGVICDWKEAENGLLKAFDLDELSNGPTYMSLYELARMFYDQKNYESASTYFNKAHIEFEKEQMDTKDPIGYADFLDEYIFTLEQLGRSNETKELKNRSMKIRNAFEGKDSHTDRTPYGTKC